MINMNFVSTLNDAINGSVQINLPHVVLSNMELQPIQH